MRFIIELQYDVAVTDRNTTVVLASKVVETSPGHVLLLF